MTKHGIWCVVLWVGCGSPPQPQPGDFTLGSANDPVVKAALSSTATTSTLKVTLTNTSNKDLKEGLITLAPLYTAGQAASSALSNYVLSSSSVAGNVSALIRNAGLTLNVNAFKVSSLGKGKSITLTIVVPSGSSIHYLARVDSSSADFVGVADAQLGGGMAGYKITSGQVVAGNSSTGTTAGTSSVSDLAACSGAAAMSSVTSLFTDEMALAAYDRNWPMSAGYDAEFNGEWYTDGVSARLWLGDGAVSNVVTGFVKFISICPTSGATITLEADVDTQQYTTTTSDTTLHLYYFDAANAVIKIDYNFPLQKGSLRRVGIYDSVVPSNARRVAIVPMARFAASEANTVFYHDVTATYEPQGAVTKKSLAVDDFSQYDSITKQPTGWSEFNGDWYVIPANSFATLWNTAWGGDQTVLRPFDTGLTRTFSLGSFVAGDQLDATIFAATTFSDPTSFARLRLLFDDGTAVDSDRMGGSSYNELTLHRIAIPATAKSVSVVVNAYLGATETSSLYVDNLRVNLIQ